MDVSKHHFAVCRLLLTVTSNAHLFHFPNIYRGLKNLSQKAGKKRFWTSSEHQIIKRSDWWVISACSEHQNITKWDGKKDQGNIWRLVSIREEIPLDFYEAKFKVQNMVRSVPNTNAYRVEKGLRSASKTRTSVEGVGSEKLNMTI